MTIETENQKSVKGRIVAAAWQLFLQSGSGQVPKGSVGMGETAAAEFAW